MRKLFDRRHYIVLAIFCLSIVFFYRCGSSNNNAVKQDIHHVEPVIIRTLPHDDRAFTQGLVFHKGKLFESTGLYGQSSLRRIDAQTGDVEILKPVADVFAEGLVLLDNSLLQLTWKSEVAILYTLSDLQVIDTKRYGGEGWGITTDGAGYIMSNGSDTLVWRNRAFTVTQRLAVTVDGKPLVSLNELEWARGLVYANVWHSDCIFAIDPATGRVVQMVDCTGCVKRAGVVNEENVLNGIAYDAKKNTFYITGKNWPMLFELSIPEGGR